MLKNIILLVFCLTIFTVSSKAQVSEVDEIIVESWKKGREKITVQTIKVELTSQNPEFEKEFLSISGKKYRLSIIKNPITDVKGEHWKVMLKEIASNEDNTSNICSDLLFKSRPCETGGDYFPREDYVAYFYPYEKKKVIVNEKTSLIEWKPFYLTKTIRKILGCVDINQLNCSV
jgi:hypothetical protein